MDKLRVEEVAINLELMKRSRFYHILNPNGTKVFNCHAYRLLLFLYCFIVSCVVVFSTLGFFIETDDTLSLTDFFLAIFVLINLFLCYWRICIFLYNVNSIHDVFSVSRFDLLKSKHCCKNVNVLNGYRDRSIKITNYFVLFSSTVMMQWILYPLRAIAFTRPEDENSRFQNIMNLRFPVSTYTYNQYFFGFYLIEVVLSIFTMYAMIMPDILLMSVCWAIIAQQEVLTRAFKNVGHEDNSQMVYYEDFKSILLDQQQLNLKIKLFYSVVRPIILTYVAFISTAFIIVTYVLLLRQSVNTGIYFCDWTKMDVKFKKLLLLTMQMNNANNLEIKASPRKIINLQLFANIIMTSYNIVSVMLKTMS